MSFRSVFSDLYSSLTVSEVHADAPTTDVTESISEQPTESAKQDSSIAGDEKKSGGDEEEKEEEEEEEPEDPFPALQEECASSKECLPAKHHYDGCVERVTSASAEPSGPKEDCVEEFFHLMHCSTQCAAPKLFAKLK